MGLDLYRLFSQGQIEVFAVQGERASAWVHVRVGRLSGCVVWLGAYLLVCHRGLGV